MLTAQHQEMGKNGKAYLIPFSRVRAPMATCLTFRSTASVTKVPTSPAMQAPNILEEAGVRKEDRACSELTWTWKLVPTGGI